ncbi:sigma-54-dependent transcriptional regulator [Polyangium jinanense]|uniref:Sigma-54-dependent Fis family transcriptional regulator n=1 Tax=Polyangium jinanense TaxID=2829994 RepID=A0A9X3XI71_9BACT|nr:sigma-54 dependent transcriptional regulator [Polyangium jinanense]MDC3962351.1 sigma-54-dependent Fis family transcriptional regulator [Polyangium jinanense]MDC3989148.1 sigma-54-dependent Fis family transcriptional regulator [Polyangium jinanense]
MRKDEPDTTPRPHILVIDDEPHLCELLAYRLEHHGYRVSAELSVRGGMEALEQGNIDAIILDLRLEDGDGMEVLGEVQKRSPDLPVIILTAHGTIETAVLAIQRGAYGFLTKPFQDYELLQKLAHAIESGRLKREVAGLRRIVGDASSDIRLLGTSESIAAVRERIARVAPADATILLLGESGTGKELAARSLHALSARKGRPFVAVNCGALPAELLESELFGHVRGAFTGASRDKDGLFAAARGGTLLLDEIGEAPAPVQVKLLRVLQEKRFSKVGSATEEDADVRIVAATNRDLRAEVAAGRFREDLFYRLHVVPIVMPPLRERKDDIPLLAELFLRRAAARYGLAEPYLSPEAMRVLLAHSWPGNVRELANVMEGAILLCQDERIRPQHILATLATPARPPTPITSEAPAESAEEEPPLGLAVLGGDPEAPLPPLRAARDSFERAYLVEALRRAGGNVSAAAKLAGRNRTDFHDLLRKHGLSGADFKA